MKVLIIGDSMIKYLEKDLIGSLSHDVHFACYPGVTVEGLTRQVSSIGNSFDWVLVHVGTNNITKDSEAALLMKFNCLFDEIHRFNPDAKIVVSSVIPRFKNLFQNSSDPEQLASINRKITFINSKLEQLSLERVGFFFCGSHRLSWDNLISRDGLHPNYSGNKELAGILSDTLARLMSKIYGKLPKRIC